MTIIIISSISFYLLGKATSLIDRFKAQSYQVIQFFSKLNLFDKYSNNDPRVIYQQKRTTRLFCIFLCIVVITLFAYTSFAVQIRTKTVLQSSLTTFKQLEQYYSDTLQCSCKQLAIPQNTFVYTEAIYHQVCSNKFLSQAWIDLIFIDDQSNL